MSMIELDHKQLVKKLCKGGAVILKEMSPHQMDLLHPTSKLCSEAGELMDAVGKLCYYQKELDIENVVEELGDIEFYMEKIRSVLGISRIQTLQHNIDKLNERYPQGFSNKAAQERADKSMAPTPTSPCLPSSALDNLPIAEQQPYHPESF